MSKMVTLRMPDELVVAMDEFAKASGWSRGETMIYAVEEFCPLPSGYGSRINGGKPERKKKAVVESRSPGVVEPVVAPVVVVTKPKPAAKTPTTDRPQNMAEKCPHGYQNYLVCRSYRGGC